MRRSVVAAVLVGVLCLTAGCQGLRTDPAQPATPAPVPTATDDTGDVAFSTRVVERHLRALDGRSRTVTLNTTVRYPNGTVAHQTVVFTIGNDDSFRLAVRETGPFPTHGNDSVVQYVRFTNSTHDIRREQSANGTVRTSVDDSTPGSGNLTLGYRLGAELAGFELSTTDTEAGTQLTGGPTDDWDGSVSRLENHRNATVDGLVRNDIIRRLTITGDADHPNGTAGVRVSLDITVTAVGESEPRPPPVGNTSTTG